MGSGVLTTRSARDEQGSDREVASTEISPGPSTSCPQERLSDQTKGLNSAVPSLRRTSIQNKALNSKLPPLPPHPMGSHPCDFVHAVSSALSPPFLAYLTPTHFLDSAGHPLLLRAVLPAPPAGLAPAALWASHWHETCSHPWPPAPDWGSCRVRTTSDSLLHLWHLARGLAP